MKAAQELGRKRWEGKTEEEKTDHAKMMSDAAHSSMTKEERKARASAAAKAKWAGVKKAAKKAGKKK